MSEPVSVAAVGTAASAAQILAAAQAQTGSPLQPAVASAFVTASGTLSPQFPAAALAGETKQAALSLPQLASAAMHLQDVASGAAVDVSLTGALPVAAQAVGGYLVYPAALASGATVFHRPLPAGSEDFLTLPTRPATPEIDYGIALGAKIAGLRLVGGTLELLDAGGAPRLHVPPPYIVGADGVRTDGALAVAGCVVDADPSPPWGRAVTAPGASTCTVRVTWPDAAVVYPAVLDPRWTTTGSMGTARFEHTLILLSTGKALAAGGRSTSSGTTGLTSAELYDPSTGSWAATGPLTHGRRLHSVTQLPTSSNSTTSGKVLVAGGISGTTSLATFELYSPSAGTWTSANMDTARHAHTATLLPDGRVLTAGGMSGTATIATASLYNPASGTGSWVPTTGPIPPAGLKNHTATLIQTTNTQLNNHVLLVGGNNGSGTIASVYLFDPVQNAFSTLAAIPGTPREQATALTLPGTNGKILVAGGKNGSSVLNTAILFDPSVSNGSWSSAGIMTSARVGHTMTLLPNSIVANGQVLVAGGSSTGSNFLSSAELFSGTSTWTATPSMPGALSGQQAVLLSGNSVLVAGGLSASTTVQTAAYLYDASFGLGCSSNSQCASGFCVSGICCDSACSGTCGACNLAGHLGACTPLSSGTVCRAQNGACDVAETCNGSSTSCPNDGFAASGTTCRAPADECDAAETCTGLSASCPNDTKKPSGTACTDDGNPCTQDQCDGTHVACQHPAGNAGTVCRAQNGDCDVAETCTGTSATCPADGKQPSGTACADDGNVCTLDQCDGNSNACQHPAGNAGTICRAKNGECDVAEACTGTSTACPGDAKLPGGTACTDDGNVCTLDQCDGSSNACQHPAGNAGTVCRAKNGECDVAEACTGTSTACPGDAKLPSGASCTDDGNVCTLDQCDGSSNACQHPAGNAGTVCRAVAPGADCDVAETCTGTSPNCPQDGFKPPTTICRAQNGACDVAENCTGNSATCPGDSKAPDGTTCNDGNACTTADACHGGSCSGTTVTCTGADQCHTVGACVPATGCPAPVTVANGTSCDDGNACTTGDSCQAGTCAGGQSSCVALDIQQTFDHFDVVPQLFGILTSPSASAAPGDLVTANFAVTNTGTFIRDSEDMRITNNGTQPFTWSSYQVTVEYLPLASPDWVSVAETSFDANGVQSDVPPLLHVNIANFVGQTIAPGQTADYDSTINTVLPAELITLMGNPAEVSQVRVEIHLDTGSGTPGITTDRDMTAAFTDPRLTARNVPAFCALAGQSTSVGISMSTGDVAIGATVTLTGSGVAPALPARDPAETDGQYLGRLVNWVYVLRELDGGYDGIGRVEFPILVPALSTQKSGPAQGTAGFTLPYAVTMQNVGNLDASGITVVDTVNGDNVAAQITIPPSIAAGATATASVNAASPVGQTPGPYTDAAVVTWKDRNGNLYGPVSPAFTTTLTAGHPEGYLTLTPTGGTTVQVIGEPLTLTAKALDQLDNPVAGLPVQLVIAGVNPQTVSLVTGGDGTATFTYNGPNLGRDTATVTATINGPLLTASVPTFTWSSSVGQPPCTGRGTPLDVMLVIDASPSMFTDDQVDAANAAANAFMGDLNPSLDQIGSVVFSGDAPLTAPLTTDVALAESETNAAFSSQVHACNDGFCPGGTDYSAAFQTAFAELQGPRHRSGASPLIVFLSDGGDQQGDDPRALIASVKAAGVRVIAIGYGTGVNVAEMRDLVASSPNDYFYAPSANELAWIYGNVDQDACRTLPPVVTAGGSQGLYEVRLPASLTLQGEVHGGGPRGDVNLTSAWTEISGPAPVTFADASSPVTDVLFTDPGTYILQLEATDGFLTTADRATITVDPAQSLQGANLIVALGSPGPLTVGTPEAITATLTDATSHPIANFAVQFAVTGANPGVGSATTNAAGVATFAYAGTVPGTDVIQATAIGGTATLASSTVSLSWTPAQSGPNGVVSQGWIGAPAQRARVTGLVPVTVAAGVTIASSTVSVWSVKTPGNVITLATNAAGGPGATLATLDTTTLPNGSYIIDVSGTDDHGNQQDNETLVAVSGDYKPGRVVVDVSEFTVPVAGIPITIGRHYDSLNKDKQQDFGFGWSLAVGHPDLEVDQANDVTITLPNGRRSTFIFELLPAAVGPVVLGFIAQPLFVPEPGTFGTLTADGCSTLVFDPTSDNIDPICFDSIFDPTQTHYAPTTYKYTDPYGTVYTMGADGTLKTVQDRNNNVLTFAPDGITSSTSGQTVSFTRDAQGRITKIVTPGLGDVIVVGGQITTTHFEYDYAYDGNGDLSTVTRPPVSGGTNNWTYGYDGAHRLLHSTDPLGHAARTSTYDAGGRLATDTDALGNVTKYAYDVSAHTTTTTYPDTGVLAQTFDGNGMLLSQTDQLGRTTTHQYDANRNEVKRTNALGEITTYGYDANGNQTSSTNVALNETTTTTYNAFSEPLTTTNPIGNTTTIAYDDTGLPTSFTDSLGLLATFTSSEHGLPISVTDVAGNVVYLGYDGAGDLTSRTDRLGRVTGYGFNGIGEQISLTTPRGGAWTYGYNGRGERTATDDPINGNFGIHRTGYDENGNVIGDDFQFFGHAYSFFYDPLNHLTEKDNPDGTTIHYTRDFRGNALTETDEAGNVTTYTYDLAGQLTKTTYADLTFTKQSFDQLGRLATKVDERNNTTTYGYQAGCDCSDRMTSITDALNRTTSLTYDGMGRKTSTTDASGRQTTFQYDLRGHLTETDYPDGTATIDTYDTLGQRIASRDQMHKTTQYGYDAEGQLTSVTDPLGNVTQYGYDADGNLTSVTDANDHTTTYAYDLMDEKTSRTLPLQMTETFTYNPTRDQITHTDFRGKTTNLVVDDLHRLVSKVPDPTLGEPTVSYTYYPNGLRETMTDASGTTTYTYDTRNRLLTKATPEGTLTYTYDAGGNVASIDSSNANGTSVAYGWDAANQLQTVTDNRLAGMTTAAYTATGLPFTLSQPNGVGVTYGYDSLDRVTSMAWKKGTNPAFASFGYGYNLRGQRTSSTEVTGREAAYGYDDSSRLTSETITGDPSGPGGNGALTYVIDAVGNRSSRISTLAALGPQSFSYDPNDELTSDGYDLNGNTTSSGGHTYGYDFENRLVSKDGGAVTLVHDGDGNRVAKTAGGATTQYLVDELNPTGYLQVMDEMSGGAVQVRFTYGARLLSQTRNASDAPGTSFYGYDAHGNTAFLTDGTGTVTDAYRYDAWGIPVASAGSTSNTRLYVGEDLDPDLGLINLRAREYKPAIGRFSTIDPILRHATSPLSFNRFLYGNADPVNNIDPSGRVTAVESGMLAAVFGALLLAQGTAIIGRNGHFTTVHTNTIGVVGIKTECNFATAIPWTPAPAAALEEVEVCEPKVPCDLAPPHLQSRPDGCLYDCHDGGPLQFRPAGPVDCEPQTDPM